MKDGFLKVAAATPDLRVADCVYNANEIIKKADQAAKEGASICVFPELCITGYTCGDLFLQDTLISGAKNALNQVCDACKDLNMVVLVGLPVRYNGKLYNAAAVLYHGEILGMVPKQFLPNYSEFYEIRHFTSGKDMFFETIDWNGKSVPFGTMMLFSANEIEGFTFGIEICEDLWVANPPSAMLAASGAVIIANLSASDEIIGKAAYRRELTKSQSAKLLCGYIYADAGFGESTQDLVFAGHDLITENGALIAESKPFTPGIIYGDLDLKRLLHERQRMNTFQKSQHGCQTICFSMPVSEVAINHRFFPKTPFVPQNKETLTERCEEILMLQATGLATRLRHTKAKTAVVGLSGGLDSTLALIVMAHAFDLLGLDRKGILAVTMPCFGTTARTKGNAEKLAEAYGVTLQTVDIKRAVDQHFADIGQQKDDLSVTFENAQARMRTLVLMNLANKNGGMVVGTGDLSELALGWATYNGDHMSMYGVNSSIPKTLVRFLVNFEAERMEGTLSEVLKDVLATPVSPELLPPKDGEISQCTEELVGPYELHDFFLYYMMRFGYGPKKIFRIAKVAFQDAYDNETIKTWLTVFVKRFFSQQFKRSCLPDGPKVGSVTLSPRGDWRMPSDACATLWLDELEAL